MIAEKPGTAIGYAIELDNVRRLMIKALRNGGCSVYLPDAIASIKHALREMLREELPRISVNGMPMCAAREKQIMHMLIETEKLRLRSEMAEAGQCTFYEISVDLVQTLTDWVNETLKGTSNN